MKAIIKILVIGCVLFSACSDNSRDTAHDDHAGMNHGDTLMQPDSIALSSSVPGRPMTMENMSQNMMQQLAGKTGDDFDRTFLPLMTAHHQGAVEMAQEALKKSKRADIWQLSQKIINAQQTEMQQMEQWFKNWYPNQDFSRNDHGMNAHMMQMLSGKSDADFDVEYLRLMIAHHRDGVLMSQPAITNAGHSEVKNLAQKIISAQEQEIDEMQKIQLEIAPVLQ